MSRKRTIVGVGEAIVFEHPDRIEIGGLAPAVTRSAVRLGHVGVPVTRVGQDPLADDLVAQLRADGAETSHVQFDPDLATPRILVPRAGARRQLGTPMAFDNLQWDYDLADLAQRTDAVVVGLVAMRNGQTRSVTQRFIDECGLAIGVLDLANRPGDAVDRGVARSMLNRASIAVADRPALEALVPAVDEDSAPMRCLRQESLDLLLVTDAATIAVHDHEGRCPATIDGDGPLLPLAVVAMVHALLSGLDTRSAVELAARVCAHGREHDAGPVPADLLECT